MEAAFVVQEAETFEEAWICLATLMLFGLRNLANTIQTLTCHI